ncbi:SdrD B-like domain-containing protein [Lentzea rhizosphaerae]|uniref:SdrD B-like domain-containing protein n=1 Tax=Lentzea rhizosphaerae TaxID=2041025 RepID=A0ABV8CAD8_9PSEU
MSGRAVRFAVLTTVALLAFGTTPALAQDEPTTTTPPVVTTSSTPPSSEPAPPPAQPQVLSTKDSLTGVLYADRNANTVQDAGEALSGVVVTAFTVRVANSPKTTTNANGEFVFRDLEPGVYQPLYELADGWVVHHDSSRDYVIEVTADNTTRVTARAERPYRERLSVTGSLDRESYHYPSSATTTVTITNISDRRISGIEGACNTNFSGIGLGPQRWPGLWGSGVALEPGEQRTFTAVAQLPERSRREGRVTLDCQFVPNYGFNKDGPTLHDEAVVTSDNGGYTMVVGEDRNANSRIDADEAVQGAEVVLLQPQTGKQIAMRTSGADGKIEFVDLPVGDYDAVVRGSWAFQDTSRVQITQPAGSGHRILKRAVPAELKASLKFGKPRYEVHETISVELTITNVGGQPAEHVQVAPFSALEVSGEQFGDLRRDGPGVRIPAGESRTVSVSGKIRQLWDDKLTVIAEIYHAGTSGYFTSLNEVEIVQTTGDIIGVVYTDKNRNGQMDPGEGAVRAELELGGGTPLRGYGGSTDDNGRFHYKGIPSGYYSINYTLADGWAVHLDGDKPRFRVEPGKPVELVARAERPFRESLKATVVLDKSTYQAGDIAKITVTLTNTSDREIRGVQAGCNRNAELNQLGGRMGFTPMPEGWGDLRPGTEGVTLASGETRTIVATEKVPAKALESRAVAVACDFAPNPVHNTDGPSGYDWASVPGRFGAVDVLLAHDVNKNLRVDPGEAVPNTRIALMTDREYGAVVADAVTDANGRAYLDQVPPGEYWAWIDGPWKFEDPNNAYVRVGADAKIQGWFGVVPGQAPAPPGTADGEQVATGGTSGGMRVALAKTGASVLGLAFLGVLLVAAGVAMSRHGRTGARSAHALPEASVALDSKKS